MAEITRKRTGEILRTLLGILIECPDGLQAHDAIQALSQKLPLTDHETGTYKSGGRRFDYIVRFTTIVAVKSGWMLKQQKGLWSITPEGIQAYKEFTDPEIFYRQAVKLYQEWKKNQKNLLPEEVEIEEDDHIEEKEATITFEKAEEQAWSEIEQHLRKMNPYDFQELVAALLRAMGYYVSWGAPPGKDGGIDILAWSDPLGTRPPRIKVQVKRKAENITVDGLRSFMAVLGEYDVGIFVTSGGFTKDARDEARMQETRKITLIDLERLFDLWVEYYPKLKEEDRRRLPLQPIYFLAPED